MLLLIAENPSVTKRRLESTGQFLIRHILTFVRAHLPEELRFLTSANAVTIARMFLIIPIMNALLRQQYATAFWFFLAAALSDIVDGWIARHDGPTDLGSLLDATCDKVMTLPIILLFMHQEMLPPPLWPVAGILFVFEGLNTYANIVNYRKMRAGEPMPRQVFSNAFGQIKFWAVCFAVEAPLAALAWPATWYFVRYFGYFALCVAALFAVLSFKSKR